MPTHPFDGPLPSISEIPEDAATTANRTRTAEPRTLSQSQTASAQGQHDATADPRSATPPVPEAATFTHPHKSKHISLTIVNAESEVHETLGRSDSPTTSIPRSLRPDEPRRLLGIQEYQPRSTGDRSYNYEEKYRPDRPGEETGPDARFFRVYLDESEQYDREMIRGHRDTLDALLVFAALFSAVVTTFVVQTSLALQPDQAKITNYLLLQLIANSTDVASILPANLGPDTPTHTSSDIWVNGLFFASLALSISTALLSVLAKQWLQAYDSSTSGSAQDRALVRQLRFMGVNEWKLTEIIGILPLILHASLAVFFIGLVVFLQALCPPISIVVIIIGGVCFLSYLGSIVLPAFYIRCPYRISILYRPLKFLTSFGRNRKTISLKDAELNIVQNFEASVPFVQRSISWLHTMSTNPSVRRIAAQGTAGKHFNPGKWGSERPFPRSPFGDSIAKTVSEALFEEEDLPEWFGGSFDDHPSIWVRAYRNIRKYPVVPPDQDQNADLHRAIKDNCPNHVHVILRHHARALDWVRTDSRALYEASLAGHEKVVRVLVQNGARISAPPNFPIPNHPYGPPLVAAVVGRHLGTMRLLLDNQADPDEYSSAEASPLKEASRLNFFEGVRLLLERGAHVDGRRTRGSKDGETALQTAAFSGNLAMVKLLLEKGAKVNLAGGSHGSALLAATTAGHLDVMNELLGAGASVNMTSDKHDPPLISALLKDQDKVDWEAVDLLLAHKVNVNLASPRHGTALHISSSRGDLPLVQMLLEKGASVNTVMRSTGGLNGTPLQLALFKGHMDIAVVLLEFGADVNLGHETEVPEFPLYLAVGKGHLQVVEMLLARGADVNRISGKYNTALQVAIVAKHKAMVSLLLKKGAQVSIKGGAYGSALQAASLLGLLDVVKMLFAKGADVNIRGGIGLPSALEAASSEGHLDVVRLLLVRGANLKKQGGPAIRAALAKDHHDIAKLLRRYGALDPIQERISRIVG